jgi:hypothetical protein
MFKGYRLFTPPKEKQWKHETEHSSPAGPRFKIVELYLQSPYAFMAWCSINTLEARKVLYILIFRTSKREVGSFLGFACFSTC